MGADEAFAFADRLARATAGVLGDALTAVVLHGSLVFDDYAPGASDIDLLVVVEHELSDAQIDGLISQAERERPAAPAPVDLRVVTRAAAAEPTPTPPMELYIRTTAEGLEVETRHDERDLLIELSVCRQHGRTLIGPPAADVIGDVPDEWVDTVGDAQLADWQALGYEPQYGALMVFTACRVWRFAAERCHSAKSAAALWVLERDPTLQAPRDALHRRRADPSFPLRERSVRELLQAVRARLS